MSDRALWETRADYLIRLAWGLGLALFLCSRPVLDFFHAITRGTL